MSVPPRMLNVDATRASQQEASANSECWNCGRSEVVEAVTGELECATCGEAVSEAPEGAVGLVRE
jgi:ribosomal protein L37AE/L43A